MCACGAAAWEAITPVPPVTSGAKSVGTPTAPCGDADSSASAAVPSPVHPALGQPERSPASTSGDPPPAALILALAGGVASMRQSRAAVGAAPAACLTGEAIVRCARVWRNRRQKNVSQSPYWHAHTKTTWNYATYLCGIHVPSGVAPRHVTKVCLL